MLKIYRTYMRAKLDYGAPIYSSAAAITLDKLKTVVTDEELWFIKVQTRNSCEVHGFCLCNREFESVLLRHLINIY